MLLLALLFQAVAFAEIESPVIRLEGKINPGNDKSCASGKGQLFLSQPVPRVKSKTLLYQVEVIPNGSFAFSLTKGTYDIYVMSSGGCESHQVITLKDSDKKVALNVNLTKKKESKK